MMSASNPLERPGGKRGEEAVVTHPLGFSDRSILRWLDMVVQIPVSGKSSVEDKTDCVHGRKSEI